MQKPEIIKFIELKLNNVPKCVSFAITIVNDQFSKNIYNIYTYIEIHIYIYIYLNKMFNGGAYIGIVVCFGFRQISSDSSNLWELCVKLFSLFKNKNNLFVY